MKLELLRRVLKEILLKSEWPRIAKIFEPLIRKSREINPLRNLFLMALLQRVEMDEICPYFFQLARTR